ncbi:MAG: DMT family transporter [Xenococcaceae cyanobacterium MO_188.B29]|nr:DMT family transporter [Xenococcaceae cyanobacterium MO_188.B29]
MKASYEGLLFSLVSMITMGISSYLYKKSTEVLGATNTTFFYYLFSGIIALFVWLIFREKQPFTSSDLFWPAILAVFLFSSVWTFNYALQFIDVSVATTIRSLGFVVTILLAIFISHEELSTKDWIAVVFAVIAVSLFGSTES